jgi:hypothetical protein
MANPPSVSQSPGEFTRAIQAAAPLSDSGPSPWARTEEPAPGEFTRMLQSPAGAPASGTGLSSGGPFSGAPAGAPQGGEFTRMWQSQPTGNAPPVGGSPVPEKAGAVDLNRYLQMPVGPMPQNPAVQNLQPQAPMGPGGRPMGEYTQVFGNAGMGPGGVPQAAPGGPASSGQPSSGATNAFAAPPAAGYPPAPAAGYPGYNPYDPYNFYGAPKVKSEYTQQIAAPAQLTFGQAPPEPPKAPPQPLWRAPRVRRTPGSFALWSSTRALWSASIPLRGTRAPRHLTEYPRLRRHTGRLHPRTPLRRPLTERLPLRLLPARPMAPLLMGLPNLELRCAPRLPRRESKASYP